MGEKIEQSLENLTLCKLNPNPRISSKCPCCFFIPPQYLVGPSHLMKESDDIDRNRTSETDILTKQNEKVVNPNNEHDSSSKDPIQVFKHFYENHNITLKNIDERKLRQEPLLIVDTHGHPHLNREPLKEYNNPYQNDVSYTKNQSIIKLISLSCAITPHDWPFVLEYASNSASILPALGVHPWYIDSVYSNYENAVPTETTIKAKISTDSRIESSSQTSSSSNYLLDLESLLIQHPNAFVGEIGLCKSARNIRHHPEGKNAGLLEQKQYFIEQFQLASKLQRGVTIHCVGYYNILLDILISMRDDALSAFKEEKMDMNESIGKTLKKAFPPVIAFHSFSGSTHFVKEILDLEDSIIDPKKWNHNRDKKSCRKVDKNSSDKSQNRNVAHAEDNPIFYFGFSHLINVSMSSGSTKSQRRNKEALQSIPSNRILVESDVSHFDNVMVGTIGAIDYVAKSLDRSWDEVFSLVASNGVRFLTRHSIKK